MAFKAVAPASSGQVEGVVEQQLTLMGLAADYQAALAASVADRAALHAQLNAQAALLAALQAKGITAQVKRVTTTATVAVGATVNVTVTWDKAWAAADYYVIPQIDQSAGVVDITTPALRDGTRTTTQCIVTFRTNVALLAAVNLNVIGLRFG